MTASPSSSPPTMPPSSPLPPSIHPSSVITQKRAGIQWISAKHGISNCHKTIYCPLCQDNWAWEIGSQENWLDLKQFILGIHRFCEFIITKFPEDTVLCQSSLTLTIFPAPTPGFSGIILWSNMTDVPFVDKHSTDAYYSHFLQLWDSKLTIIKKLFWWGLRSAPLNGHRDKYFDGSWYYIYLAVS